jgi:hypothetical protein
LYSSRTVGLFVPIAADLLRGNLTANLLRRRMDDFDERHFPAVTAARIAVFRLRLCAIPAHDRDDADPLDGRQPILPPN